MVRGIMSLALREFFYWYLLWAGINIAFGLLAALGMFFLGQTKRKPKLARLGMILTPLSGIVFISVPTAIAFFILLCVLRRDIGGEKEPPALRSGGVLVLNCLDGEMRGRTYAIGSHGIVIGRDGSCAVRYSDYATGISGQHCMLYWQGSALMLSDLNSTYGTYMADGSRLPPQFPVALPAGSMFYIANNSNLFQVVIMN